MIPACGIVHKTLTASTNDDVKNAVCRSAEKLYICEYADRQSSGRGRLGRSFISESGGIYFTFSVPLTGAEKNIAFLTGVAGLCVCRALEEFCGAKALIKWPNDIILNDRKICGILCELVSSPCGLTAVCGIGINNRRCTFPAELAEKAASLEDSGFIIRDAEEFIAYTVRSVYSEVYENGVLSSADNSVIGELREKSWSVGREALYADRLGTVTGINSDGSVRIDFGTETLDIASGEIIQQFKRKEEL